MGWVAILLVTLNCLNQPPVIVVMVAMVTSCLQLLPPEDQIMGINIKEMLALHCHPVTQTSQ